jgi:DNA primase
MEFADMAAREISVSSGMSFDTKEQVKQAIDIVDLVGSHIQLRRQGRNFVGLCPWHDDSKPSLQVNPERQSFKCWVCDIGGDVFSFVMKMEGVEFREALKMLADRAGITLERPKPVQRPISHDYSTPDGSEDMPDEYYGIPVAPAAPVFDKHTLYRAMHWAEKQYHECLLHSPGAEAGRKYLKERGISDESIEKFHLGFSPLERDWILQQIGKGSASGNAKKTAGRAKVLEGIGILARPAEGGSYFDRFRGRLLFSIHDAQGRPVGIGGRVLPELGTNSPAKYVNSPETPLFTKSKLLYGLDIAGKAIRGTGGKHQPALIMEGYTDVIVAHQYGFTSAVAVLGTAVGAEHIKILRHYTDRIILVLDGDEAGQKRMNEVLELFVAEQVDMRILILPEGLDPCDFLHERGPEAFQQMLDNDTVDALDHAFRTVTRGVDVDRDVHAASQALERLVSIVAKAPRLRATTSSEDRFREEKILQRMASIFRIDEREVRERLTALRRRAQRAPLRLSPNAQNAAEQTQEQRPPEKLDACQKGFLEILLAFPESFAELREQIQPDWLGRGSCRAIFEICDRMTEEGIAPSFERLMTEFDDPAMKNLLVEYDESGQSKNLRDFDYRILVGGLLKNFEQREIERKRPANVVELREGEKDPQREAQKLEEILNQERRRQGITKFTEE